MKALIRTHNSWVFPANGEDPPGWIQLFLIGFLTFMGGGLCMLFFHDSIKWLIYGSMTTQTIVPWFVRAALWLTWVGLWSPIFLSSFLNLIIGKIQVPDDT